MIPGATVSFGGKDYTLPTINLRISYMPEIDVLCDFSGEVAPREYNRAAANVLFTMFKRNYSEMTRDEFDELIELHMLKPVLTGMLQMSGLIRPLEVETMAALASASAKPPSSDSSTPLPDGGPTTSSTD